MSADARCKEMGHINRPAAGVCANTNTGTWCPTKQPLKKNLKQHCPLVSKLDTALVALFPSLLLAWKKRHRGTSSGSLSLRTESFRLTQAERQCSALLCPGGTPAAGLQDACWATGIQVVRKKAGKRGCQEDKSSSEIRPAR